MEKFYIWQLRQMYQLTGVLDEYRLAQVEKINSQLLLILVPLEMLATVAMLLVVWKISPTDGFLVMVVINAIVLPLLLNYGQWRVSRMGLNTDVLDAVDYDQQLHRLKHRAIWQFIYFVFAMWLLTAVMNWLDGGPQAIVTDFDVIRNGVVPVVGGALVAGINYWQQRRKLFRDQ